MEDAYELDNFEKQESSDQNTTIKEEKPSAEYNVNGLSVLTAAVFIVGEICGAGAISFPQALSKTGIYGEF